MSVESKSILVTGGAGFIGSHLVDVLVERGASVTVLDDLSSGKLANLNKKAKFIKCDIVRDERKIRQAVQGKDWVFHLAASATTKASSMGWADPIYDYQENAIGTLNVLRKIAELGAKSKLIYASSAAVYGEPIRIPIDETHPTNPISPYGVSKLAGEKYCFAFYLAYGLKSVILRLFNTYGPRQPRYVMFDLLKKLQSNSDTLEVLGTGKQIRDYSYVTDTVEALILAAKSGFTAPSVFNVAGGCPLSIKEVAEKVVQIAGLAGKTNIHYTGNSWKGDISVLMADISKIKEELGFRPKISLDQGLWELYQWFVDKGGKP